MEKKWTTFYGKSIEHSKLSHQHICNIIYYFRFILGMEASPLIKDELHNRFGDIMLPYHPLPSFTQEIQALKHMGYTNGEMNADIIIGGKWVGKIVY